MKLLYQGIPLRDDVEATFTMTMAEEGIRALAMAPADRRVRIDLVPTQRWPDQMKRGRPLICTINDQRFTGKIAYRRMHRLVLDGRFESVSP